MTKQIRISHSAIRQLTSCPRLTLFEKELRLYPVYGSIAMKYGSAYHAAMEAYYKSGKDLNAAIETAALYWSKPTIQDIQDDYRNLENLITSIVFYHERYQYDNTEIMGIQEHRIETELLLSEEEKDRYGDISVLFVAVIDLVLVIDGMKWVVDFKTTSVELPYLASRLRRMPQLMGYQFVGQDALKEISGTMIYYHQLKATKSRTTGLYGAPKIDFMPFPQIYSRKDYNDWRSYVIFKAFMLNKAKEAGYPPDFNACFEFNRSCPYLPLCDYPKWDLDRFMEMDGFVIVPDEREQNNNG